ncbi:unnamed protein product [Penicillium manginii]
MFFAWRREAGKKGRVRRPKRYPLSDKFQSSIDKEIFHLDWSLKPGWSCEKKWGVFHSTLLFSKGDEEWTRESLARKRDDELRQRQMQSSKDTFRAFTKPYPSEDDELRRRQMQSSKDTFSAFTKPYPGEDDELRQRRMQSSKDTFSAFTKP